MKAQIENIVNLAALLIIEGKATKENAIERALEIDSVKCLRVIEDIADMKKGYLNGLNVNQKAYSIVIKSVYDKLAKP